MKIINIIAIFISLFLLVACGGGGNNSCSLGLGTLIGSSSACNTTVTNVAPIANAGLAKNVLTGSHVTLDGSKSTDANNDPLTYKWTLISTPTSSVANLSSSTDAKPTFTADVAGTYVASLTVNDGKVDSTRVQVTVIAASILPPVANAVAAQNVLIGSLVTLDGSTSTYGSGVTLSFTWALTSYPAGSAAALSSTSDAQPTFTADLAGNYVASLVVNNGLSSSTTTAVTVAAVSTNPKPSAIALALPYVMMGSKVTLDGSTSKYGNSFNLSYRWTLTSTPTGSIAVLSSNSDAKPTFTADLAGTYVASLTVNDGTNESPPDVVAVSASTVNVPPVANAGPNQNVLTHTVVTLDGSASSDANKDPLTYVWMLLSKPAGSSAALPPNPVDRPTFTADLPGSYVAKLTVNDGQVDSAVATTVITAKAGNVAPTANAGTNQTVANTTLVTLDGSASSDPNHDPISYAWILISKPTGSFATLTSSTSAKPTFSTDVPGTYVASLIVNDGIVNSPAVSVAVTSNAAPVAIAGADQSVKAGAVIALDGSKSTDANNDTLTYKWVLLSRPLSSSASLTSGTTAKPTFTADLTGDYVATLIVNDGIVDSAIVAVKITATAN